jgi:hypothetical protein
MKSLKKGTVIFRRPIANWEVVFVFPLAKYVQRRCLILSVTRLYHDTSLSSPYGLVIKDYLTVYLALYRNIILSDNCRWAHNIISVN